MKGSMGTSPRTEGISRWMLGLLFALLLGTHVALPCASAFGKSFSPSGGMCREDGVAHAPVSTNTYFMVPMPEPISLAATAGFMTYAVAVVVLVLAKPNRMPLSVSTRGRPFATSDPPHLPCFAAQRDA